jgi:riboflavin synthase
VAEAEAESFVVWIIPHTFQATCLRERGIGGAVNLEFDLLGKYVENLLACAAAHANRPRRPERRAAPTQSRRRRIAHRIG